MGFRFRRSISLIPGVRVNLSTTGASLSLGAKGATVNLGRKGVRGTYDLPGSGAYYSTQKSWGELGRDLGRATGAQGPKRPAAPKAGRSGGEPAPVPRPRANPSGPPDTIPPGALRISPAARLDLTYFQRLSTPDAEAALLDGLKLFAAGDLQGALGVLPRAARLPDGAFVAGLAALGYGIYTDAARYLSDALAQRGELGQLLAKYGAALWASIAVTEEVTAHVRADAAGALLALAEAQQRLGDSAGARASLRELLALHPQDLLARLSLAEILSAGQLSAEDVAREVAALGEGVENDSQLHCALLLYQARALRILGLNEAAKAALTKALSKRKDRSPGLLAELRVERAGVLEALGDRKAARADYERAYAEDPDYPGLADLLARV